MGIAYGEWLSALRNVAEKFDQTFQSLRILKAEP
jgi:hypothetical protein